MKLLPNSWFKIDKDCQLVANVCHNVTAVGKPIKSNTVVYQGSLKLINMSRELGCKNLKKIVDQDLVKTIMVLNGLRLCNEQKSGVQCRNSTIFKYDESGGKTLKMLMMTATAGDVYRMKDTVIFEKGQSCVDVKVKVVNRKS